MKRNFSSRRDSSTYFMLEKLCQIRVNLRHIWGMPEECMTNLQKHSMPGHLNFWNEDKFPVSKVSGLVYTRSHLSFAKIKPKLEKNLCSYYRNTFPIRLRLRTTHDGLSGVNWRRTFRKTLLKTRKTLLELLLIFLLTK